jgi:antitoxin component YwqK of YwqJK toxin-antitoxin module
MNLSNYILEDIIVYVLSDYIEYDNFFQIQKYIHELYFNPNRVKTEESYFDLNKIKTKSIKSYIDNDFRRCECWFKNGYKSYEYNFKNKKLEGKQYKYLENGIKWFEYNYKDGKKDGIQYKWKYGERKWIEENYQDGYRISRIEKRSVYRFV